MTTSGKVESIPSNTVMANPKYLRIAVNKDHVQSMYEKLQDVKDSWPFPPVHVQAIPASEEKLIQEGYRYYYIDGHHRGGAALMNGSPVKAIVHSALTQLQVIAMQISTNVENGLAFNHTARKRGVVALAKEGMKQVEIVKITSLPKYTVSRILKEAKIEETTGTVPETTSTGRKKRTVKPFDAERWERMLYKLMDDWGTHRKKIVKIKGFPKELANALDNVVGAIPEETEATEE